MTTTRMDVVYLVGRRNYGCIYLGGFKNVSWHTYVDGLSQVRPTSEKTHVPEVQHGTTTYYTKVKLLPWPSQQKKMGPPAENSSTVHRLTADDGVVINGCSPKCSLKR